MSTAINRPNNTNFFDANKDLAKVVSDFINRHVALDDVNTRKRLALEEIKTRYTAVDVLLDEKKITEAEAEAKIATLDKEYADIEASFEAEKEALPKYKDCEDMRKMKKTYGVKGARIAIDAFCRAFNLVLSEKDLKEVVKACGGVDVGNAKTRSLSDYTTFNLEARKATTVRNILLGWLAEKMLKAGTLKIADIVDGDIPTTTKDYYLKKEAEKEARKAAKKAENK